MPSNHNSAPFSDRTPNDHLNTQNSAHSSNPPTPESTESPSQQQNLHKNPQTHRKKRSFPLFSLPPELRHKIYGYYIASLPDFNPSTFLALLEPSLNDINKPNSHTILTSPAKPEISQPLLSPSSPSQQPHPQTPLHHTSHRTSTDIPLFTLYTNLPLLLTNPLTLLSLSTTLPTSHLSLIRRVKIVLSTTSPCRDWVFLVLTTFPGVEALEFCFELEGEEIGRREERKWDEGWWSCVRDAVREGVCCECFGDGGGGRVKGRGRRGGVLLSVRWGDVVGRERVGGVGK